MSTFRVVPLSSLSAPEAPLRHAIERGPVEELARSIASVGLLQPLTVRATDQGYEVVAGHRRLLALRLVGLSEVPVIVRDDDEASRVEVMLAENLERRDLNPVEEARALQRARDLLGMSIDELARRSNRSEAWVRQRLELLSWPAVALEAVSEGRVKVAVLRPLMEIEDERERDRLVACAIDSGATSAVTLVWAQQARGLPSGSPELLSGRSAALLGVGDVVVHMPCYSCREPRDAFSLQVLRVCRACLAELEAVSVASARSEAVAEQS